MAVGLVAACHKLSCMCLLRVTWSLPSLAAAVTIMSAVNMPELCYMLWWIAKSSCRPIPAWQLLPCRDKQSSCCILEPGRLSHCSFATLLQVVKSLQALAMTNELRFEVSKQTALAFVIKRAPADLHQLAEAISQRHGIVSKQQAHRLDVAYCSFAAAAAAAAHSTAAGSTQVWLLLRCSPIT